MKAFPNGLITDDKGMIISSQQGMDLRDYFAAKAMQALYSNPTCDLNADETVNAAWEVADAMMKAREAKE